MNMRDNVDLRRVIFLIEGIAVAAIVFALDPSGSEAGFAAIAVVSALFATATLSLVIFAGRPGVLHAGTWRAASAHRRQIKARLRRYEMLCQLYIVVILATCTCLIFTAPEWLERLTLAIASAGLIWSFGIPKALFGIIVEHMDEDVENRKRRQ